MAPEIFSGEGYDYKADMFSLGSVFFNLLTGCFLFSGATLKELYTANEKCDLSQIKNYLQHTSHHCKDLVTWMLEKDPLERPSPKEALKHAWFKSDKAILKNLLSVNDITRKQGLFNVQMIIQRFQNNNQNLGFH